MVCGRTREPPSLGHPLMLSLKPRWAEAILGGDKKVELRRLRPNVSGGDLLIIYASLPRGAVIGSATVMRVVSGKPTALWRTVGDISGLSHREFMNYFAGAQIGFGILLARPCKHSRPITLSKLRRASPNFAPPQAYRYLRPDRLPDSYLLTSLFDLRAGRS